MVGEQTLTFMIGKSQQSQSVSTGGHLVDSQETINTN
jgi:hypothetical protein